MSLSRFNQQWYDQGRSDRLKAQLQAYQTKTPVFLPLATHHATAFLHWRNGWNSVSMQDIKNLCQPSQTGQKVNTLPNDPIANARRAIGVNHV
jgi:hypothetical protein